MSEYGDRSEVRDYEAWQVLVSALVAVLVTSVAVWWVSSFGDFYESLYRVAPAADGAAPGVGADWVFGNTLPSLDFLIALVHALDVIMGVFILFMVFLHWGAFRRLADRMSRPGTAEGETVVADGGDVGGAGEGGEEQ